MEYLKQHFNIKDLESFSGIKAHTIRIWEKRYQILQPKRTSTNIRVYDLSALQKLLNISFLNDYGYKISKLGHLSEQELEDRVQRISAKKSDSQQALQQLKIAMINFDQDGFLRTYRELAKTKTFDEIFNTVFIPLLHDLGLLWQTNTINPAQEHFVSHLIRQKLYVHIEAKQERGVRNPTKTFILFLPENEIHDLGLLYVNYLLLKKGYRCIYLGASLPLKNLAHLSNTYQELHFLSYLTVQPTNFKNHLAEFEAQVSEKIDCQYWMLGPKTRLQKETTLPANMKFFETIEELTPLL